MEAIVSGLKRFVFQEGLFSGPAADRNLTEKVHREIQGLVLKAVPVC